MGKLTRRRLLATAGVAAALSGCISNESSQHEKNKTMQTNQNTSSTFTDRVQIEETKNELEDPETSTALGITNNGVYLWDANNWIGPLGGGAEENPIASMYANTGEFTGHTLIKARLSQNLPFENPGISTIPFDTLLSDKKDEFNTDERTFTIEETGQYFVSVSTLWESTGANQEILIRLTNIDDDATILETQKPTSGEFNHTVAMSSVVSLEGGKSYQVRGGNITESSILSAYSPQTHLTIYQLPV